MSTSSSKLIHIQFHYDEGIPKKHEINDDLEKIFLFYGEGLHQ